MDKHTCKLCFRRFSNGRALGGHMRSHVTAGATARAAHPDSSASASSTSSREDDDDGKGSGVNYGLRENPRKSFRLVDPEFSSSLAAVDAASSVVQDRESETESPRPPPCHRRRSKRPRRGFSEPPEPVSSVSDTTAEEDVAISLMMLSRDVWTKHESDGSDQELDGYNDEAEADEQIAARSRRSGFQCESCKKVFGSYQALGGHRASHKKLKQACAPAPAQIKIPSPANAGRKLHECPVCFRVFASGQALGGHKRSHLCSSAARAITIASSPSLPPPPSPPSTAKYAGESLIDLNLPAPMDEDATELSAVSDSNFAVGKHPTR